MADDTDITPGTGKTVRAEDIGGKLHQYVIPAWGPAGTANKPDVATGKPFPTQIRSATGLVPIGEPTDAKSTATDATSASLIAIAKQISASAQTIAGAMVTPGQTTKSASVPVVPASDYSLGVSAAATFTPAAASHVAGDVNGAAAELALGAPSAGRVMITSASLYIDNTAAEVTAWRVHLYNVTPTSAIADDSPWDFADADVAQYLGSFDLPSTGTDIGTNQWAQADGINKQIKLAGTSVFAYLQNLTTLTPAAAAHIVTIHAVVL